MRGLAGRRGERLVAAGQLALGSFFCLATRGWGTRATGVASEGDVRLWPYAGRALVEFSVLGVDCAWPAACGSVAKQDYGRAL